MFICEGDSGEKIRKSTCGGGGGGGDKICLTNEDDDGQEICNSPYQRSFTPASMNIIKETDQEYNDQ